jgi:hypothetical protein
VVAVAGVRGSPGSRHAQASSYRRPADRSDAGQRDHAQERVIRQELHHPLAHHAGGAEDDDGDWALHRGSEPT